MPRERLGILPTTRSRRPGATFELSVRVKLLKVGSIDHHLQPSAGLVDDDGQPVGGEGKSMTTGSPMYITPRLPQSQGESRVQAPNTWMFRVFADREMSILTMLSDEELSLIQMRVYT